mgnify:FL=1
MDKKKPDRKRKKAAALKYDINKDNAPKLIAKGEGEVAEKLLETAEKFDIPIEENEDIIDLLIKLNIGEEIPEELYQVIAEILSFIYRLDRE